MLYVELNMNDCVKCYILKIRIKLTVHSMEINRLPVFFLTDQNIYQMIL